MKIKSKRLTLIRPVIISFKLIMMFFYANSMVAGNACIIDTSHYSHVFGEIRNYRIFLPPGYFENSRKRYPVIYFFHGWSQRYFGPVGDDYSNYDKGDENDGDNIANYVSSHDVIVVKPDGFNPSSDLEYNLTPYNEGEVTTFRQFPVYFPEFVDHIDASFRTIADRDHRAVTGLSMGGFMSFWIGGKYPHMVSAVGNFCGSPEFIVGPLKFPAEYRNIDMYGNYGGLKVRFHYGDKDNLRFYHEDMDRIWPQVMDNYEYRIYDAAHSTCGMGEMFDFCLQTFENPPEKPQTWNHIDVYPEFSVWDYQVSSDRFIPGFTILENVNSSGFRCSVKDFLPDGETMPFVNLLVTTAPVYEKDQVYLINDVDTNGITTSKKKVLSDHSGRLKINLNGGIHNIGINKIHDIPNLAIASVKVDNMKWGVTGKEVKISVKLLNKGLSGAKNVLAKLSASRNFIDITANESPAGNIDINEVKICRKTFSFKVRTDSIEIARFMLTIRDEDNHEWKEFFDLRLKKDQPELKNFVIADGKVFPVAKAGIYSDTLFLGKGNGDGIANPGESIVILIKDNGRYYRTNLYSSDENVNPFGINRRMSDDWGKYDNVGGSAKYSIPLISSDCPENHQIVFFAEYWYPEKKKHIIKQGIVNVPVSGKDLTPPVIRWMHITGSNIVQAKITDGSPVKFAKAKLIPVKDVKGLDYVNLKEPESSLDIVLNDAGNNGDATRSDGVFSERISTRSCYFYRIEIEAIDSYGNRTVEKSPEVFIVYAGL